MFHDKFGIAKDDAGDLVAFHGSANDSALAGYHGESFSVFCSWAPGQSEYVKRHAERFERLWHGENEFYDLYDLDEALKYEVIELCSSKRPYAISRRRVAKVGPELPSNLRLRDFQQRAIDRWLAASGRGLLEMATGTGKTIAALAGAVMLQREVGQLAVFVSVPFSHLLDQWSSEAMKFGFSPMSWQGGDAKSRVGLRVRDFNSGGRKSLFVVSTHKSFSGPKLAALVSSIRQPTLLIADEVHYLGAPEYRKGLPETVPHRLGLSATPDRWFDPAGTRVIRDYFGETVGSLPLGEAIGRFLTPYVYYPHLVELTDNEMDEFSELSRVIRKLIAAAESSQRIVRGLESLLRKRARIVSTAAEKVPALLGLLQQRIGTHGPESISHTIIYCAPGETGRALRILGQLGLRAHEFTYQVPNSDRARLLRQFADGELQVLAAIKCLDEGVDIPATKEVYFMSSTSNPREFVQRRGRVLRKYPGKSHAVLHDMVVVPPHGPWSDRAGTAFEKVLLAKEMPRVAEFCAAADNQFEARDEIFKLLKRYDLVKLLELRPWDVYRQYSGWGDYSGSDSLGED
ncbi:MAG: DEAD/DEAH box helicase [Bacillota bacterium]|nr:MAG: DEAD/DEAH box helicase [Bacillota bacterium]